MTHCAYRSSKLSDTPTGTETLRSLENNLGTEMFRLEQEKLAIACAVFAKSSGHMPENDEQDAILRDKMSEYLHIRHAIAVAETKLMDRATQLHAKIEKLNDDQMNQVMSFAQQLATGQVSAKLDG